MENRRKQRRGSSIRGFTLSEVTISVGIVAGILLPTLALLATGTRLSADAADQASSSQIARSLAEGIVADSAGGRYSLSLGRGESELPLEEGEQGVFAVFTRSREFLRSAGIEEYDSGIGANDRGEFLVRVRLRSLPETTGGVRREPPLLGLSIDVEWPVRAAEADRERRAFHSRLVAP